ncbi:MAG: hypothetical protein WC001_08875 [Desulfurivibrionaceae bacterium]
MPTSSFLPHTAILVVAVLLAAAPSKATDTCDKHLKMTCNNCHSLKVVCEQIGNPPNGWKEILSRMRLNGAELSRADIEAMVSCMSQPSEAAKAACWK